jgi:lipopolysaccharide transport system permease protein
MTSTPQRNEIVIRPASQTRGLDVTELVKFRGLLVRMARRQIAAEFSELYLGVFWAVARPVLMTLIFVFFRKLSNANTGVEIPYPAYLFSGLIFWFYFVEGTNRAAASIGADAAIMQKVYFPRLLSPLSGSISQMISLFVNFIPLIVIMISVGVGPGWRLILLPVVLAQTVILIFGAGCLFAALSTYNKDWIRLLKLLLYVGLFMSPVIFAPAMLPQSIRPFFFLNPMAGGLLAFRSTLFSGFPFPTGEWLYTLAFSLGLALVGVFAFLRAERSFLDRI